ncbi:MAG: hypothetical protein LBD72_00350 [Puniceicoccales bacterium]|nr:hypothetical protein [Puniceicoccales bacterium]
MDVKIFTSVKWKSDGANDVLIFRVAAGPICGIEIYANRIREGFWIEIKRVSIRILSAE